MLPDKRQVLKALISHLDRELAVASESQKQTALGATHEESRPENDKDTRALESSYLARGQAKRVVELGEARLRLEQLSARALSQTGRAALGMLLLVEEEGRLTAYFLAPGGGGLRLQADGVEVRVITPDSPLGAALLGKGVGDTVEVRTPQGVRELSVVSIA
jgi:transcription elongation GreA/GreB family factor